MSHQRHRYLSAGLHTLQDRERRLRLLERLLDQASQRRRELRGTTPPAPVAPDPYTPTPETAP